MQKNKGFTLIELLIVISIIGLLSSVVLVGLGSFRSRGRDARRVTDIRAVQNMLELYFTSQNTYPTGVSGWTGAGSLTEALTGASIGVSSVPNDPLIPGAGVDYQYGVAANGLNYTLGATLEDGANPVLNNDVDANPSNGLNCTDPLYCVEF
ncbi:MAG: hypothetical protein A2939_03905 [Parcubacteria group bacterium RIFCSPLOWO2_01_FULL_48_18]|nr:MAG: hypothetical protein A2939_03905 [Parcubacteria group bacterium RIFCSPLOWO2_01_FULL_48_18]